MKVLFLVAHPDDEAYGPYGMMLRAVEEGHDVHVYCLCNGTRPGSEEVSKPRTDAFIRNCESAGVKWKMWDNNDLSLDPKETAFAVSRLISSIKPDIVYTHNISDVNRDHRALGEAALIACRPMPDSSVNALLFFEVPSSTDWAFGQLQPTFMPNHYVEISEEDIRNKFIALEQYSTEVRQHPDARSIESMMNLAKYRGQQVGYEYAEAFQLVFSRDRKSQ